MNTQDTKLDPAAALQQLLSTLEFVKIVTHLKDCERTGPALARMVTDEKQGSENIALLCTALVSLQAMLGRMQVSGQADADALTVQKSLVGFMERLGNEHEAASKSASTHGVLH